MTPRWQIVLLASALTIAALAFWTIGELGTVYGRGWPFWIIWALSLPLIFFAVFYITKGMLG